MTAPDWFGEADWLASENPHHLLAVLERQHVTSRRKYRLAAVACCRAAWPYLSHGPSGAEQQCLEALAVCERYADGDCTQSEMIQAARGLRGLRGGFSPAARHHWVVPHVAHRQALLGLHQVLQDALGMSWGGPRLSDHPPSYWVTPAAWASLARSLADLIRCSFGNPFRPVRVEPGWTTSAVVDLARAIDADRASHLLPILADALQDAGCEEPAMIGHCRDDVTHARGCWVVDAVLGRL